ncbi:MAG: GNAT family N-acetyltransferase [Ignavibacteria bacterium]|jgi:RimJ/RimL family protein N-acetyltransferase
MLKLVKYSENHIGGLLKHLNNENISRWIFLPVDTYTIEDAKKWLEFCKESDEKKDNFLFAIELNGELIGGIGLHKKTEHCFDVGYWIAEKHWGKGYATEALKEITDLALNELKIDRIQAYVFDGNISSEKVLEKCGYEYEGYLRKSHKKGDKFYNSKLFAKIK